MAKLSEVLAESAKEVTTLKEEAEKAETLLKEVQLQLCSKSQNLETTNSAINAMKAVAPRLRATGLPCIASQEI